MAPILFYRMQEAVHGGMSQTARARLQRLIAERSTSSVRARKERSASQPASKLIRSWGGEIHEVLITDEGYVYRGETFRSCHRLPGASRGRSGPVRPSLAHALRRRHDDRQDSACAVYTRKSSEEELDQSFNCTHNAKRVKPTS